MIRTGLIIRVRHVRTHASATDTSNRITTLNSLRNKYTKRSGDFSPPEAKVFLRI